VPKLRKLLEIKNKEKQIFMPQNMDAIVIKFLVRLWWVL
jgi:hypothetical protein